jgi:pimeloyl-ACP methyl ester carboxylesterase
VRRQRRHPAGHLLVRGLVAAVCGTAMTSGLYPVVPTLSLRVLSRRSDETVAVWSARLAAEWATAVAVTASRPLGLFGLPLGRPPRLGPRPVILLHGYTMSRSNFFLLAERLHRAGLGPLIGFEYWTLGSIAAASDALAAFVELLCAESGAEQVDLVGHSMGGVVARHFAALGGGAARVKHLVTLGSPHRGTPAFRLGVGRANRELRQGSELLAGLERAGIPPGVAMTVIWSRADSLVWHPRQATVDGAEEIVYDDLGHLGMLASRRVAAEVAARLRR